MSKVENAMWAGSCNDCGFIITVDGDGKDVPDPGEWDSFPSCPVCGGTVHFDSCGETNWRRETRLMNTASRHGAVIALRDAADDPALRLSGHSGISITRLRARADRIEQENN